MYRSGYYIATMSLGVPFKQRTVADIVFDQLQTRYPIVLWTGKPQFSVFLEHNSSSSHLNRLKLISNSHDVYRWLSVYGSSAFVNVTGTTNERKADSGLHLSLRRVAAMTGDVQVVFTGESELVIKVWFHVFYVGLIRSE